MVRLGESRLGSSRQGAAGSVDFLDSERVEEVHDLFAAVVAAVTEPLRSVLIGVDPRIFRMLFRHLHPRLTQPVRDARRLDLHQADQHPQELLVPAPLLAVGAGPIDRRPLREVLDEDAQFAERDLTAVVAGEDPERACGIAQPGVRRV